MPKRAVLYARVSTGGQADNYSLPTQLETSRACAQQHDFRVLIAMDCGSYTPFKISGRKTA